MPKKKVEAAKPEPAPKAEPAPKPAEPEESYKVIRRGDAYVVEVTLYGRVLHDHRSYPYLHDATKRMEELSKHLK